MERTTLQLTPRDHLIARFAALAIAIHILEAAVPMPLPGVKPGLANIIVLLVLLRHGFTAAVQVSLLRVVIGSIFIGTFLTPTFILSFSGALASLLGLGAVHLFARRITGAIGYSVAASMLHMTGQFLVAYALFIPHPGLFALLPVLLTAALGLGIFSGIIAAAILERLPPQTAGAPGIK